ncbi:MAG: RNA polymerase sigma factor, partial [Planctomycetota bacterium]
MTEEDRIIRRVIDGEVDLFRALVERYQKPVLRMINNIINDPHTCEDVGQEVFLAAYKKLASFDAASSKFSTWLFTIARNKSFTALRKSRPVYLEQV